MSYARASLASVVLVWPLAVACAEGDSARVHGYVDNGDAGTGSSGPGGDAEVPTDAGTDAPQVPPPG